MNPSTLSGLVTTFFRILGSTVVGPHSAVLEGVDGAVGGLGDTEGDEQGEGMTDVEAYGALGIVARARPPQKISGTELAAEGMGLRTPRGTIPLVRRDLRLNRRFPAPKPGSIAFVGYGGAFLAFDDADGDTTISTHYVPYARDGNGVATKAHSITIDPVQESIKILHGDGGELVLMKNREIMAVSNDSTWWQMKPGQFNVQADQISLVGSVYVGTPTGAFPLVKFAELAAAYDTHVHPTAMGPSGVPAVLITPLASTIATTRVLGI